MFWWVTFNVNITLFIYKATPQGSFQHPTHRTSRTLLANKLFFNLCVILFFSSFLFLFFFWGWAKYAIMRCCEFACFSSWESKTGNNSLPQRTKQVDLHSFESQPDGPDLWRPTIPCMLAVLMHTTRGSKEKKTLRSTNVSWRYCIWSWKKKSFQFN